jgi:hypothetical protein
VFLSLLAETGLLGAGLFVLLLLLWTRDAWLAWRSPHSPKWVRSQAVLFLAVAANYAVNGMFHDMSVIPMANMLLFFVAGVTSGAKPRAEVQEHVGS